MQTTLNVHEMTTPDLRALDQRLTAQLDALDPKDSRVRKLNHDRRRVRVELYRRFQAATK
jgi:hypothetical protein